MEVVVDVTQASRSSSAIAPVRTPKVVGIARPTRSRWQIAFISLRMPAPLWTRCSAVDDATSNTSLSPRAPLARTVQRPTAPVPPPSQAQQEVALRRTRRSARRDEVRNRRAAGYSIQRIARELGMHRRTVRRYRPRRWFRATAQPSDRDRAVRRRRHSSHSSSTYRIAGKPAVRTWRNCNANWTPKAIRAATHC